jgi:hypothetical protein
LYGKSVDAGQPLDVASIGFFVAAIRKAQYQESPARPQSRGVAHVLRRDRWIDGEEMGERINRQHQVELLVAENGKIAAIALTEPDVCNVAAAASRLANHAGRNVDPGDRANMRRQRAFDPSDPATDVEHHQIQSQQLPFRQSRDDLAGCTVEDIRRAERIERHRGLRRDRDRPIELAVDRGNVFAARRRDVYQPSFGENPDLHEVIRICCCQAN